MAARICSVPAELGEKPAFNFDKYEEYAKAEAAYVQSIVDWCKKHGQGELKGEEVRFPVADGYARYIVLSHRPLQLIHVPTGDAWHFQYAHRLTVGDLKEEVRRGKAWAKLFSKKAGA